MSGIIFEIPRISKIFSLRPSCRFLLPAVGLEFPRYFRVDLFSHRYSSAKDSQIGYPWRNPFHHTFDVASQKFILM
jgi:hypothetical protein